MSARDTDVGQREFTKITGGTSKVPPLMSEKGLENIKAINANRDWRNTPIGNWSGIEREISKVK
jgi:hypothetical protein